MSEAWEKINQLAKDYRFDQCVLDDIYNRLRDCQDGSMNGNREDR